MKPASRHFHAPSPTHWLRLLLALGSAITIEWMTDAAPADSWAGRWDLTVLDEASKPLPSWLELRVDHGVWRATFVGRWGNARPLPKVVVEGDRIQFVSPKEEEGSRNDLVFDGELSGASLAGSALGPNGTHWAWTGRRAPALKARENVKWAGPITLFNGRDFSGWMFDNPSKASSWVVEDGCLVNKSAGSNIATDGKFQDFKLHIEVNCPTNANSGVYLRGRYEVQIEDDSLQEPPSHHIGAVYGFLAPAPEQPRRPGVWQAFDITLIGRFVTVVQNGQTIIDHQEIPGITGGAFDSHEELPGPIYLQGDHGGIAYRNIVLTPALASAGIASEQPVDSSKEVAGQWLGQWTVNTADTTLTLGVGSDQKLYVFRLASPAGWNWTAVPSPFPLVSQADIEGERRVLKWGFKEGAEDRLNGSRVTITFTNADPALELTSAWQARGGPGPVRHTMTIKNQGARRVTLYEQESLDVQVAGPGGDTSIWYINDDGSLPDKSGVYHDPLDPGYQKVLRFSEDQDFIPLTIIDAQGGHGVYIGWEWSIGRMAVAGHGGPGGAAIRAGNGDNFRTDVGPGDAFDVPPGFIGAYQGDLDDAGNSLRKYLFNYSMPSVLRDDPGYPKVEWNAFAPTGKGQGSWRSTETKYYPFIDDIAPMGFEEVVLDIGWWPGDATHKPHPPVGDGADWPSGILAARNYAHDKGMRFGLYWNCNPSMTTLDGIQHRQEDARYLYDHFRIDFFRSDGTDGNVLQTGGHGPGTRAHYAEDAGYWQTKGYYQTLDSLYASITNFSYENCSGGGRIKDYGILRRCMKIQNQDRYYPLDARQSFYDSSFALHPMQIAALCGSWAEWQASGSVYEFRSASMGAPYWHPDAPNGGNGGPVWTAAQRAAITEAVKTYKTMIRPLVRTANLYHVFPRPTGKIWDGVEYFDPASRRGAVYVFRPESPDATHTVRLKGLEAQAPYWLWCADGSFPPMQMGGESLMRTGLTLGLPQPNTSEIVFVQDAALGRPEAGTRAR
ncbi:MAG: family 16 glycoside hydrolase [Limisphaerales bacterium]